MTATVELPAPRAAGPRSPASIVVCTYTDRRLDMLGAALHAAADQCAGEDELIVVVDHNPGLLALLSDRRSGVVPHGPAVTVLANEEEKGLSGARNTGVHAARREVVVFLDDDAVPRPGWLEALTWPFASDDTVGVGGWVAPSWQGGEPAWWPRTFNWVVGCSYTGLPETGEALRNPIGASMALRRGAIAGAGYFRTDVGRVDEHPHGCEETEVCIRIAQQRPGARIVLERQAVVDHHVPAARKAVGYFTRRCFAEGLSKALIAETVGSGPALASERSHAASTIPRAALDDIRASRLGVTKAAAAVGGLVAAGAGYANGRLQLRRHRAVIAAG